MGLPGTGELALSITGEDSISTISFSLINENIDFKIDSSFTTSIILQNLAQSIINLSFLKMRMEIIDGIVEVLFLFKLLSRIICNEILMYEVALHQKSLLSFKWTN